VFLAGEVTVAEAAVVEAAAVETVLENVGQ